MRKLLINDITLRDGEQAAGVNFFPEEKLKIAEQLVQMKVPIIEAGFAIASESDYRGIQLIATELGQKTGPVICAMARGAKKDIEMAADSVSRAEKGRVQVVIPTSDIHAKYKLQMTRSEIKEIIHTMVGYAKSLIDDVEFAAEDATRSDKTFLLEAFQVSVEAGAKTVEIPDTVGYAMPDEYAAVVRSVVKQMPEGVVVATHCHNDLGLAVANTLAGIRAGANQAELTINGLGERAGNASLEEVVMAIKTREKYFNIQIDIDTTLISKISKLTEKLSRVDVAANKAIVGKNAFLHESGIHQHGMLCNKETYQIIDPEMIGLKEQAFVIGKLSGKHAFKKKIEELGYQVSSTQFQKIYTEFKDLAGKKKRILEEDIINLMDRL